MSDWKQGMPRGKYYEGMFDDYEAYFSPGGVKWHRRRTPEEKAAWLARKAAEGDSPIPPSAESASTTTIESDRRGSAA